MNHRGQHRFHASLLTISQEKKIERQCPIVIRSLIEKQWSFLIAQLLLAHRHLFSEANANWELFGLPRESLKSCE
ncbi:hypothetical protein CEXT_323201 [Caerostris extrusa]|uniref:Uncharacterized protein n=1 Tax=Caerostris extrusa TaxID=172846 RepID=A0AAV4N1E8_CAEEX|nr:hypothetical protein CEXT_323201 [Caerostris extrusa]